MIYRLRKIVNNIVAKYIHDPEHKKPLPGPNWHRTPRGMSDNPIREKAQKGRVMNPRFKRINNEQFASSILNAKQSRPDWDKWRVDAHNSDDYKECKNFVTTHGSTFSVKPDGDIISVCKMNNSNESAKALLKKAIHEGGKKLDAFGKELFKFYTKNGFYPVALTNFNRDYAPEGWKEEYGEQPIIFYKLNSVNEEYDGPSYDEFVKNATPMEYDDAAKFRDNQIK